MKMDEVVKRCRTCGHQRELIQAQEASMQNLLAISVENCLNCEHNAMSQKLAAMMGGQLQDNWIPVPEGTDAQDKKRSSQDSQGNES